MLSFAAAYFEATSDERAAAQKQRVKEAGNVILGSLAQDILETINATVPTTTYKKMSFQASATVADKNVRDYLRSIDPAKLKTMLGFSLDHTEIETKISCGSPYGDNPAVVWLTVRRNSA